LLDSSSDKAIAATPTDHSIMKLQSGQVYN